MRVAILMKRYSLLRGGGEYDLVRLSRSLLDRGHEVHLFINDVEGEPDPRLHLHPVPMNRTWAPLKILSFAKNAPREVERSGLQFDVVHAMTQAYPSDLFWNGGGLQINWLPARYGKDALRWARFHPRHAANLSVEKKIFEPGNYRQIVCLSEMERNEITGYYGVPEDRFHVIPNGIDPERFNLSVRGRFRDSVRKNLNVEGDRKVLLFVGSDWIRKGVRQLLEALSKMRTPFDGLLVLAGNDPPSKWIPLVRQLGLEGKVRFHGREREVERLYAAADLLVLASVFDGYGNVIPEAMGCGCPILTAASVGAADFVEEGRTGWILRDVRNREEYAAILELALRNSDLEEMGKQAASKVAPFTWDWTVDRLVEVYERISADKP
jgi:UDP-glucose:(heptosyl)LPS alpha-1,3-glucosyltransferase